MSWVQDTKFRLQIVTIGLAIMCPAFLIWRAADTKRQIESVGWPKVAGEVLEVVAKQWLNGKGEIKYYGRAVYRYTVEGKEYNSDLTDLGPGTKRADREAALADVVKYRPGTRLIVYYDPNDPSVGILENGVPPVQLALLIGLSIGTIAGFVRSFFTIRGWLKAFKKKASEPKPAPISETRLSLEDILREFGKPEDSFKPGRENVVAGWIIGLLLIVGGCVGVILIARVPIAEGGKLPWFRERGHSWFDVLLIAALGLGAIIGGLFLLRWMKNLSSMRIMICPKGVVEVNKLCASGCRWEEIVEVEETILHEHLPLLKYGLKYALPAGKSRIYLVRRRDGKEFVFDGNRVKGLGRLGKALREKADSREITWNVKEVSD